MKKTLVFVIVCLLFTLFLLTGCGDEPGNPPTPPPSGTTYKITFNVGKYTSTVDCEVGEKPVYKGKVPTGYTIAGWDSDIKAATADATYTAVLNSGAYVSDVTLMSAYKYHPITYIADDPNNNGLIGDNVLGASYAFLTAVLEENANELGGPLRDKIVSDLRFMIAGGHEQICDACCYWSYNCTTAAIALCKATESIWNELEENEVAAFDCMMRAYACMESFATADYNDYLCGPGRNGNYNKGWNPNYRLANVPTMLWCCCYFGGAQETNAVLNDFDYDTYMEDFDTYGFTNIKNCWAASSAENNGGTNPMMQGGSLTLRAGTWNGNAGDSAGTGVGVKPAKYGSTTYTEYTYGGMTLSNWAGIFDNLLAFCFSGGEVKVGIGESIDPSTGKTVYQCYTLTDPELNPVLGEVGMMFELVSSDTGGLRSSTVYCMTDFNLAVGMIATAEALGMWDHNEDNTYDLVRVGCDDLLYKRIKGYRGFSGGNGYDELPDNYDNGAPFFITLWLNSYSQECLEFLTEAAQKAVMFSE